MSFFDGVGGALVSGAGSLIGGELANSSASDEAQRNRDFQADQSATAHQREVKDLKAAGLNPILSAGGPGASTPTGNMAPVINSLGEAVKSGVQSFSASSIARQQDAQVSNLDTSSKLNTALAAKAAADTTSAMSQARKTAAETDRIETGVTSHFIGSKPAKAGQDWLSHATDTIGDKLNSIVSGLTANSGKKVMQQAPKKHSPADYGFPFYRKDGNSEIFSSEPGSDAGIFLNSAPP